MKAYLNFSAEKIIYEINGVNYEEEWFDVYGYEGLYLVSSFGRVFSKRDNKIMKQYLNDKGYLTITLSNHVSERRKYKVHRLVGAAFIPNPQNKPEINHIDFDKTNNQEYNLAWVTPKENTDHSRNGGRRPIAITKQKVGEYPLRFKKIIDLNTGIVYDSVIQVSGIIGISVKELRKKLSNERPNNTSFRWLDGQYSLFYKKSNEMHIKRYHELKEKIYGTFVK